MNLSSRLSLLVLVVAAAMPLALSTTAQAQTAAAVTANSFGVEQVKALTPGTELAFRLSATPGSEVTVQIDGATSGIRLNEVRPGVYEGDYTVRTRDKLTAASGVTARIVRNGREVSATLNQSLVRGAPSPVQAARIGAFTVNAPERIRAGDELKFSLSGVPGGKARVAVEGINTTMPLTEVSRGLYEGSYTVSRKDRLRGNLVATGFLKVGQKETSQRFVRDPAVAADAYGCDRRDGRNDRNDRRADMVGASCGVVTAVAKTEIDGDSSNALGTVAGGVLGAVIGNQVGSGSGKDIARIVGAVGGAYAGNRIQNARDKTMVYRVTVQLDDGSTKSFDHAVDPMLLTGARVKIVDGAIVPR